MKSYTDDQIENMLSKFRSTKIKEFSFTTDTQKLRKNFIFKRVIPISVTSFVALIAVFVILVNTSPAFAEVCKQIPVLSSVTNVVTNASTNSDLETNKDVSSKTDQKYGEGTRLTSPDDIVDPTQTDNYFDNPPGISYENVKEGFMPDLINVSGTDAVFMLKQAKVVGYRLGYVVSPNIPEGKVCYQSIATGTEIDPSMMVTIYVSMGPKYIPNYIPPILGEPKLVTYQGNRYLNCGTYAVLKKWDKVIETANIPSQVTLNGKTIPVTIIGDSAFSGQDVKTVVIPNSITAIQDGAFATARSLTTISIPNSVKSIGDLAFAYCTSLTSISIPESVQSLGNDLFNSDTSLRTVTIAGNIRAIKGNTFYGCSSLTSVSLPDSVTSIGNSAFYNCTALTSIKFPKSLLEIQQMSFWGCKSLKNITIPSSVKSIGFGVFGYCNIFDVYFLGNAPIVDGNPFDWSSQKTQIHIVDGTSGWTSSIWSTLGIPGIPLASESVNSQTVSPSQPDTNGTPSQPDTNGTPSQPDTNGTSSQPDTNGTSSQPDTNGTSSQPDTNGTSSQ
ncbi:MAG: Chitin binding protein [Bacillales bacterium]|jgi:hypothetical protein|nr:Chitin binding protein [Bacillales bacterium]